jgi:uncharacterized protein YqeY
VLRKILKSNQESLALVEDEPRRQILRQEIDVLASLLPKSLGPDEILQALAPVLQQIRDAASDGQATGIAMKQLKASSAPVDGKEVAAAVQRLRHPG